MIRISVVVPAYNRANLLKGCLGSLSIQSVEAADYEVIIVDNNSTDHTEAVARSFIERHPTFRYVKEPRQGVSHVYNRGWKEAHGECVAFIDDDARALPDWVERILNAFETVRPAPAAVGGEIRPWYEQTPPGWFKDKFEFRSKGDKKCFLKPPRAQYGFSGSNMAFKKSTLAAYGGFSNDYGRIGDKMRLGVETELFIRIYKDNPLFWYDPAIRVEHWVPVRNMSVWYRLKRGYYHGGISATSIQGKYLVSAVIKTVLFLIFKCCILLFRVRWWQKYWQISFLKHAQPIVDCLAFLKVLLSGKKCKKNV